MLLMPGVQGGFSGTNLSRSAVRSLARAHDHAPASFPVLVGRRDEARRPKTVALRLPGRALPRLRGLWHHRGVETLTGVALHRRVIEEEVLRAHEWVWIATANLKDMHVAGAGRRYVPILQRFDEMSRHGVTFRIVHSDVPSQPFRDDLERFPRLTGGALELQICPRSHWKLVLVDGRFAYVGSANFTGAGLGARSERRRNLEIGLVTEDGEEVRGFMRLFDRFWMGEHCRGCGRRDVCPDPIDQGL